MPVEVKTTIDDQIPINWNFFHYDPIWHRSQNEDQYDDLWEISRDLMFTGKVYFENCTEAGMAQMTELVDGILRWYQVLKARERENPILINFPLEKIVVIK